MDGVGHNQFVYDVYLMVSQFASSLLRSGSWQTSESLGNIFELQADDSCETEAEAVLHVDRTEAEGLVDELDEEELRKEYDTVRLAFIVLLYYDYCLCFGH